MRANPAPYDETRWRAAHLDGTPKFFRTSFGGRSQDVQDSFHTVVRHDDLQSEAGTDLGGVGRAAVNSALAERLADAPRFGSDEQAYARCRRALFHFLEFGVTNNGFQFLRDEIPPPAPGRRARGPTDGVARGSMGAAASRKRPVRRGANQDHEPSPGPSEQRRSAATASARSAYRAPVRDDENRSSDPRSGRG
jgi:hypothetical protein